jgi:hypothetical protein
MATFHRYCIITVLVIPWAIAEILCRSHFGLSWPRLRKKLHRSWAQEVVKTGPRSQSVPCQDAMALFQNRILFQQDIIQSGEELTKDPRIKFQRPQKPAAYPNYIPRDQHVKKWLTSCKKNIMVDDWMTKSPIFTESHAHPVRLTSVTCTLAAPQALFASILGEAEGGPERSCSKNNGPFYIPYAPWCWYIYLNLGDFLNFRANVGKYSIHGAYGI